MNDPPSPPSTPTTDLRFLLSQEHLKLTRGMSELSSAARAQQWALLQEKWPRFQASLHSHYVLGTETVLPQLKQVAPREARALESEHARVLEQARKLGHALRARRVDCASLLELLERVEAHLAREDSALLEWADAHLRHMLAAKGQHRTGADLSSN